MNKGTRKWIIRSLQVLIGLSLMLSISPAGAHLGYGYLHHDYVGVPAYMPKYNPDWMKKIPNHRRLSELSIPETHDTMCKIEDSMAGTQSLNLTTQLHSGIRSLDIRLQRIDGRLEVWHGIQPCFIGEFIDVLGIVAAFLSANPSETILMRIAENKQPIVGIVPIGSNPPFLKMVWDALQPYRDSGLIWTPTSVNPTLGEVRGKIVILEHFSQVGELVDGYGSALSSLALDSLGNPHISYNKSGELWYASRVGNPWVKSRIDGLNDMGRSSLALDRKNGPYVSYYNYTMGELWMAKYVGGSGGNCVLNDDWDCEVVDDSNDVGAFSSLALDSKDNPHISYYDTTNGNLKYAFKDSSGWHIKTVDEGYLGADVGRFSSLALDDKDKPYIGYYDGTQTALIYAYQTGIDLDGEIIWGFDTVDSVGEVGQYTSLAVDLLRNPHISYYDATNGNLKYAFKDNGVWQITKVDWGSENDVGMHSSLALDADDNPHISYYDANLKDLKYAFWDNNSGWVFNVGETEGDVGLYTSLALDENNRPHVSYYDATNDYLMYADLTSFCGDGVSAITLFGLKDGPPCFKEKVYWKLDFKEEIFLVKWPLIKLQLNEADAGPWDRFYLNGLNGTTDDITGIFGPHPWFVASGHITWDTDDYRRLTNENCTNGNPPAEYPDFPCNILGDTMLYEGTNELTLAYLNAHSPLLRPRRWGIIVMDFPGRDLIDAIIMSNFPTINSLYIPAILK